MSRRIDAMKPFADWIFALCDGIKEHAIPHELLLGIVAIAEFKRRQQGDDPIDYDWVGKVLKAARPISFGDGVLLLHKKASKYYHAQLYKIGIVTKVLDDDLFEFEEQQLLESEARS